MKTSRIPAAAATLPLLFSAMCDPESASFSGAARDVVVGLGLAVDRSWSIPLPQLLAPIAALVPIGSIDLRAAIALSIPAAIASYLIARRIVAGAGTATTLALAFSATTAVILAASPIGAALAVIAIELAFDERQRPEWLGAATLIAAWGAPRLIPVLVAALWVTRGQRQRAWLGALPVLVVAAIPPFLRRDGWLSIGNPLQSPWFSGAGLPSAAILRGAIVLAALGIVARMLLRSPTRNERGAPVVAIVALVSTIVLRAPGAIVVCGAVLSPLAVTCAGALSIAVERHLARPGRAVLTMLVPALALGLGARAFEVETSARRLGPATAAHDLAPLVLYGLAPGRAVVVLEDEASLLALAHARIVHGVRPDLRALPAQVLTAGGAARITNDTIAAIGSAADPLRALLAHGTLEPADVAPLSLKTGVLAELPAHRLRAIARHAAPTGGALSLALERVDPSDRRIRRPSLERRLAFLATTLGGRPASDRLRRSLRVAATREARVLSTALDREAALAALVRASSLGADPLRIVRWTARVTAKQTLENEPESDDD